MIGLLCIALSCLLLKESSAASDKTINAAVFQVAPPEKYNITASLEIFKTQLKTVNAQLIVFPEYAFTGFKVDDLAQYSNAINSTGVVDGNLTVLNEFAKDQKAHVVANVIERDGDDYYSTTVVLNGGDKIVAKYRKINTNSSEVNLKAGKDIVTFDMAPLGKIGLISGDDILYGNPSNEIVSDGNVTTIIHTTAFRSFAPFRTALSVQQGYAQANRINLLVANLQDPQNGFSGSGVYYQSSVISSKLDANEGTSILSKNPLETISNRNSCQLMPASSQVFTNFNVLVSKVSDKKIGSFNLTYKPEEWITQNISKNTDANGTDLCDGDFCCNFQVQADKWPEFYRIAVKGGDNSVCALLWCEQDGTKCGYRLSDKIETKFNFIQISHKDAGRPFRPYTLRNDLMPIPNPEKNTYFCQNDTVYFNTIQSSFENIVVFGIVTASGASSLNVVMGLQLMLLVTVLKFFFTNL